MEKLVLKETLSELIGTKKVVAALFYTFNFDPKFFENYIMPLLVMNTGKNFSDEEIHNKILWRNCAKENLIPPIAVYCDYYAKDLTNAPSLGYDIHCVKMPAATGRITNFHPKQIFILLEDNKEKSLLFINGSGNITVNGWCDNFECFSCIEIKKNKTQPNRTSTNSIQEYISKTNELKSLKKYFKAEDLIYNYLNYVDIKLSIFNNFSQTFNDFLDQNIFTIDSISEIEIISPYFSNDDILLKWLQSKGIKTIKCLVPSLRNNEVQLEKERFIQLQDAGLQWCYWDDNNLNKEVRNQHSKIYKLYSEIKCYTIIGSVNFTNPAWDLYTLKNNRSNIESAILYTERNNGSKLLKKPHTIEIDSITFISGKLELENSTSTNAFNRNAPDIEFRIDWKNKELNIIAKIKSLNCSFHDQFSNEKLKHGTSKIQISEIDIKILAKNAIIKIAVVQNSETVTYTYYANQDYIETKPFGFKLDVYTILKYWQFFDDDFAKEGITRAIAEKATDESGIIDTNRLETKLLLNEMATHFNGLIRLEKFLFPVKILNQAEQKEQFANLQYYLLSENIDTLSFYLSDIAQQYEQASIQNSFYWMVIQIIDNMMYVKAEKCLAKKLIDSKVWSQFIKDIKSKRQELALISSKLSTQIPELKLKEKWIVEQLIAEYD